MALVHFGFFVTILVFTYTGVFEENDGRGSQDFFYALDECWVTHMVAIVGINLADFLKTTRFFLFASVVEFLYTFAIQAFFLIIQLHFFMNLSCRTVYPMVFCWLIFEIVAYYMNIVVPLLMILFQVLARKCTSHKNGHKEEDIGHDVIAEPKGGAGDRQRR